MNKQLRLENQPEKWLDKSSKVIRSCFEKELMKMFATPEMSKNLKKYKGYKIWRVGMTYRLLYTITETSVDVIFLGTRENFYKRAIEFTKKTSI